MGSLIEKKYQANCDTPSDIFEHLPTLYEYGQKVKHVTECGVRSVVSSYAFANALRDKPGSRMVLVDPDTSPNIPHFLAECAAAGISATFYQQSDLECPIEPTELLFIDTWHVYGQLKRELARWNPHVSKYIIMHDTTVDGIFGESVRTGSNIQSQAKISGFTEKEIQQGLWLAIIEFLADHPEWKLEFRYMNNNGLTILVRV
jgi:hypothetical protein